MPVSKARSDPFRFRFPSLVNCCTIDWYTARGSVLNVTYEELS